MLHGWDALWWSRWSAKGSPVPQAGCRTRPGVPSRSAGRAPVARGGAPAREPPAFVHRGLHGPPGRPREQRRGLQERGVLHALPADPCRGSRAPGLPGRRARARPLPGAPVRCRFHAVRGELSPRRRGGGPLPAPPVPPRTNPPPAGGRGATPPSFFAPGVSLPARRQGTTPGSRPCCAEWRRPRGALGCPRWAGARGSSVAGLPSQASPPPPPPPRPWPAPGATCSRRR